MHPPPLLLPFLLLFLLVHLSSAQTLIGALSELQHDVSGTVYAINQRTLEIRDFTYDGLGPAGVFWLNVQPQATRATSDGRFAHSLPSCLLETQLPRFSGDTVQIELPQDLTLRDVSYFSIWCQAVDAEFGGVQIPATMADSLPVGSSTCADPADQPMSESFPVREGWNCHPLSTIFQARWRVVQPNIQVELVARIPPNTYMGFGPSGQDNATVMVGSDVAIAYDSNASFVALDYHLESREQCSGGQGVCQDLDLATSPGVNDVSDVSGDRFDDLLRIQYTRPLAANDPIDRPISIDAGTYVTWAIGPVDNGLPLFHVRPIDYPRGRDVMIEFGRTPNNACPRTIPDDEGDDDSDDDDVPGFVRPILGNVQNITARIGPSAGARGYGGITGGNAWGISWYLSETGTTDDILIPALGVERGKTYTFRVYGGTPEEDAGFHPFYITKSSDGGYNVRSPAERRDEGVYAGIEVLEEDAEGGVVNFTATAVGSLCLLESDVTETSNVQTWDDYAASLDKSCTTDEAISANYGTLTWTVPQDAPDLLYYQCVTHRLLGYRIAVFNEGEYNETVVQQMNGGGELTDRQNDDDCVANFKGENMVFTGCTKGVGGQVDVFFTVEGGILKTLFRASVGGGGYAGFGWGYSSMVGSNAMIVYDDGGEAKIDNFFLEQKATSGVQPAPANVSGVEAEMQDGMLVGMFSREMNATGLPLLDSGENDFIWAVGSTTGSGDDLENHGRGARGNGRIDLANAEVTSSSGGLGRRLQVHGFLMGVSWSLLAPYAVLTMRFFKKYNPVTFQVHRAINLSVIVLTVVGYLLVIFSESKTERVHLGIGSFVAGAAVLQGTSGILRPHKDTAKRRPWFVFHSLFGSVTMSLGFANVMIGIGIAGGRARWYVLSVLAYASMWVLYIIFSFMPRKFPIYETAPDAGAAGSPSPGRGRDGGEDSEGLTSGAGGDRDQVI